MAYELITNWSEHNRSLTNTLRLASKSLCIFDENLEKLKLDCAENAEILRQFLVTDSQHIAWILIKDAEPLRRYNPRLMALLASHSRNLRILVPPPHFGSLHDSMVIADDRHALIRFHKDHVRSKVLTDTPEDCAPYANRFSEILRECSEQISATALGL